MVDFIDQVLGGGRHRTTSFTRIPLSMDSESTESSQLSEFRAKADKTSHTGLSRRFLFNCHLLVATKPKYDTETCPEVHKAIPCRSYCR